MVNELDLALPSQSSTEQKFVEPTNRELIIVALHTKRARDAIEDGRAHGTKIRPIFLDRLAGSNRERLIELIESKPILPSETEHYALRLDRGENFFVIDRIPLV